MRAVHKILSMFLLIPLMLSALTVPAYGQDEPFVGSQQEAPEGISDTTEESPENGQSEAQQEEQEQQEEQQEQEEQEEQEQQEEQQGEEQGASLPGESDGEATEGIIGEETEQADAEPDTPEAPITLITLNADENTVYTEDELIAWCEANGDIGGSVSLGQSITFENGAYGYAGQPIRIQTGSYGIVFDGGSILPLEDAAMVELIGEGIDVPVLTVLDTGWPFGCSYVLQYLNVTATGRGGESGAVAVRIEQEEYRKPYLIRDNAGRISANGPAAVGLEQWVPMDIWGLDISADGENSAAVAAPGGTVLKYCKLSATGAGAGVLKSYGVELNTCALNPPPDGDVTVIERRIIGVTGNRLYVPVPLGATSFSIDATQPTSKQFLVLINDEILAVQKFWLKADSDALAAIDTGVAGVTTVPYQFSNSIQDGLGLTENFPILFDIDVRDPALPCIADFKTRLNFWDENKELELRIWEECAYDIDALRLEKCDDGGETWTDITNAENVSKGSEWLFSSFIYAYTEVSETILFRLKAPNGDVSNVMALSPDDVEMDEDTGGDRNGTERIIGVKPKDPPGNNGGGNGTDTDSNNGDGNGTNTGGNNGDGNDTDSDTDSDNSDGNGTYTGGNNGGNDTGAGSNKSGDNSGENGTGTDGNNGSDNPSTPDIFGSTPEDGSAAGKGNEISASLLVKSVETVLPVKFPQSKTLSVDDGTRKVQGEIDSVALAQNTPELATPAITHYSAPGPDKLPVTDESAGSKPVPLPFIATGAAAVFLLGMGAWIKVRKLV